MARRAKALGWIAIAVALGLAGAAASAPADTIAMRQTQLKALGAAFKTINDELRRSSPDAAKIKAGMVVMNKAAAAMPAWFPAGTGPESGAATKARPEIWKDKAGFAEDARAFAAETRKLQALAASGDFDAMKAQAKTVGGTCGACHSGFRVKDPT